MFSGPGTHNVQCPWHYQKLSAPGTCNVQCPWHYHLLHCTVYSILLSGFWCDLSVLGFQPIPGMIWESPVWLWDSSFSSPSPWEWSGYWLHLHSVPHCWMGRVLLLSSGVWWNDALPTVSLLNHAACVVCLLQFFSQMQSIFVWLFMLATGQPICASWWWWWCWCRCCCSLRGGRLALSSSNWVVCLWALGSVHLPWAPHWVPEFGCHGFTTLFRRGGWCTGPTVVDKQLNRLVWYEIDGSFIVSSHIQTER